MLLIDSLAEEQINAAIRRGELKDLPGQGKPLALEDDSAVPEALRVAYRVLRNAGYLPPVPQLLNEIRQVEGLLLRVESDSEHRSISRRLCLLRARLALEGREGNLLIEQNAYRQKLLQRFAGNG